MNKKANTNSSLPAFIIVGVLIAALVGAYFYYNYARTPASPANTAATNSAANRAQQSATAPLGAQPPNMLGSPTAAVTIEEFADFQCAACASVHPTMKEIQSIYGNRIRFVFRNFPLAIPQHDKAYEAAVAVEAAGMQDRSKFWVMQDQLFVNQQEWSTNSNYRQLWEGYAQKIGLDVERFKSDMAGRDAKARVDADMQRGRGLSIDSTPTIFINGKNVPMQSREISALRQIIDAEIQNAIKTQTPTPASTNAAPAGEANNANK